MVKRLVLLLCIQDAPGLNLEQTSVPNSMQEHYTPYQDIVLILCWDTRHLLAGSYTASNLLSTHNTNSWTFLKVNFNLTSEYFLNLSYIWMWMCINGRCRNKFSSLFFLLQIMWLQSTSLWDGFSITLKQLNAKIINQEVYVWQRE